MEQPVRYLQQEVGSRAQPCISWHTFSGLLHLLNSDTKEKNWSSQFLSSSRLTVKPLVAKDIWKIRLLTEMVPERLMGSSRPVGSSKTWFYCFQGLSVWGPQLQLFFFSFFFMKMYHKNHEKKSVLHFVHYLQYYLSWKVEEPVIGLDHHCKLSAGAWFQIGKDVFLKAPI